MRFCFYLFELQVTAVGVAAQYPPILPVGNVRVVESDGAITDAHDVISRFGFQRQVDGRPLAPYVPHFFSYALTSAGTFALRDWGAGEYSAQAQGTVCLCKGKRAHIWKHMEDQPG